MSTPLLSAGTGAKVTRATRTRKKAGSAGLSRIAPVRGRYFGVPVAALPASMAALAASRPACAAESTAALAASPAALTAVASICRKSL